MALAFTFDTLKAIKTDQRKNQAYITGSVAFDSSYPAGGELLTDLSAKFKSLKFVTFEANAGYTFSFDKTNNKVLVHSGAIHLDTPAFSGTGLTAAGQAMTTTSTHTMALNECAGYWLMAATATTPPMLIVSNTAVNAAAAVLTVIGAAATDAGDYKVVTANSAEVVGSLAALTAVRFMAVGEM